MNIKTKTLTFITVLCFIDVVIPIPILGIILICVILQKPPWFKEIVREIYDTA